MSIRSEHGGFTLVELMVVVLIIAALAGMVLPRVIPRADEARREIARGEIGAVTTALNLYRLDVGRYPTDEEGLDALQRNPGVSNWKGPYLERAPHDPWKRKYAYKYPGVHNASGFDLASQGPNPADAADDVTNWQP
jgi:general secretion pathway protein G